MHWRADTRRWHATIEKILADNPASADALAMKMQRFQLAFFERDFIAAGRIVAALPQEQEWLDGFGRDFWMGAVARAKGDVGAAQAAFTAARAEQEAVVRAQPNLPVAPVLSRLAVIDAALGRKEEALREGRRAVGLMPITKDPVDGPASCGNLALIYAWTGERDLATEQVEIVAKIPAGPTYGELRLSPVWDPLRGDPRFERNRRFTRPEGSNFQIALPPPEPKSRKVSKEEASSLRRAFDGQSRNLGRSSCIIPEKRKKSLDEVKPETKRKPTYAQSKHYYRKTLPALVALVLACFGLTRPPKPPGVESIVGLWNVHYFRARHSCYATYDQWHSDGLEFEVNSIRAGRNLPGNLQADGATAPSSSTTWISRFDRRVERLLPGNANQYRQRRRQHLPGQLRPEVLRLEWELPVRGHWHAQRTRISVRMADRIASVSAGALTPGLLCARSQTESRLIRGESYRVAATIAARIGGAM